MVVDSISNMKIGEGAGPSGLPAKKKNLQEAQQSKR